MSELIQSAGGMTGSSGTGGSTSGSIDLTGGTGDLSQLLGPDISTALSGGAVGTADAPSFDPALFEPGGAYSPTGTAAALPATPQVAAAQQDPSGQIPADQQQVDRTGKGDRQTTQEPPQQTVDRTGRSDLAQVLGAPPAGPTGAPGDQTRGGELGGLAKQATGGQPAGAAPTGAAGTLPQLARQQREATQAAKAAQPSAVDAPTVQQPTPPAQQPGGGAQPTSAARPASGGTPAPVPGAQPSAGPTAGAAPAGVPGLLQAILNMLGLGGLTGGGRQLQGVAGQAFPQRPIAPLAPTAGLGPLARARARAGGQPGQYQQPSQDDWTRNVSSGRGLGPAPGATDEVSAPTAQQVQQSRLAGTDTAPTAGFSPVLERERGKFRTELNDPRTKWETLAVLSMEHAHDPAAVAESLLNRSDYSKTSLHNMIHSGFYGPVNFGLLGREIRRLQSNPQYAARLNAGLETALRGSNLLGGATDQGSGRDPNVGWRGGRVIRFGETYNDWGGGPGGHSGAAAYRKAQQQRVRAEQQEAKRGDQMAMDINRRVPFSSFGTEMEPGGGMIRRGAPASEYETILEQLKRRDRERREAVAS